MKRIDLHMHSSFSDDGECSPKELLELGRQAGLTYLSVIDHNCVRGVSETQSLSGKYGIQVISGVELDCMQDAGGIAVLAHPEQNLQGGYAGNY